MQYLLGVDIGTSGTKTALYNLKGESIVSKVVEYPLYQPQNGWAEQDPADWWNATVIGIQAVLEKSGINPDHIGGVGLSGQMHGLVMLDENAKVLRRSIIWADQRTEKEVNEMNQKIGKDKLIKITANPAMTGFTAAKILWVQNNEPEIFDRCRHILLPKDYIRYMLTGEFATEVSDASGMQLMNIAKRDWSSEMLSIMNIDRAVLGDMYESQDITGKIHKRAAKLTGLSEGTIVVGGAGDNPAAAIGTGVIAQGKAFTTIGTSAVIYAVSDKLYLDNKGRVHSLCASVPGKWTVMSCTQAAGLSLQWLRNTCCSPEIALAEQKGVDPYMVMDRASEEVQIGADKLLYLPYLMGERSPHLDPNARGVFFGLSAVHERKHMIRAVLEGVAYSQKECFDIFREMGVPVNDMLVTGGGGRSPIWRQMLADLYECPVSTLSTDEGPALGVALLAGVACGVYASIEEATNIAISKNKTQSPIENNSKLYKPYFELYKELYVNLKDSFEHLSNI